MTGRLELHCLDLRQADDEDEQLLSEDERQRAARFVFPQLRLRFIAAHSGLRRQLGHILGVSPASLVFQSGPHGKPFLPAFPQISFNLSHSGDLALLAIWHEAEGTPPALGVDVEACRTSGEFRGVSRRFFTPTEQRALPSPDSPDFHRAFLSIWTRKEAVTKCLGTGLRTPLNSFSVLGPAPADAAGICDDSSADSNADSNADGGAEEFSSPTRIFVSGKGTAPAARLCDERHAAAERAVRHEEISSPARIFVSANSNAYSNAYHGADSSADYGAAPCTEEFSSPTRIFCNAERATTTAGICDEGRAAAERAVRHEEISSPASIFFKPQGGFSRGLTAPRTVNWVRPAVSHATSHDTPGEASTATSLDVPCVVPHEAPHATLCTYAVDFAAWGAPQYAEGYVAAVCLFLRE